MDMKKCPICGEKYSDTYKKCPFCEEEAALQSGKRLRRNTRGGKRTSQKSPNLLTPMLIILILIMAALLVYLLFGERFAKLPGIEKQPEKPVEEVKEISIDEFFNTKLIVATVKTCENVEKSNKLYKLTLDVGDGERTVASGLKNYYKAEELIGKKVILVANLKPAKLCGILSEGMILCAEKDGKVVLISPEVDMPAGSVVG